jgi:ArsR family metal-binding transcriptional regulator
MWSAKAHLQDDITEVLPYLNAELEGADYDHDSKVLIWATKGRKHAFRPHEIAVAPVEFREEGDRLISNLVATVNDIWDRRQEIRPDLKRRKRPTLMDVYRLLPKSNCKKCGYPTCMGYAADLRAAKTEPSKCPDLSPENEGKIRQLVDDSL